MQQPHQCEIMAGFGKSYDAVHQGVAQGLVGRTLSRADRAQLMGPGSHKLQSSKASSCDKSWPSGSKPRCAALGMHAAAASKRHRFMCTFVKRTFGQAIWREHCWALLGLQTVGGNSKHNQLPLAMACLLIAATIITGILLFIYCVDVEKNLYCSALSC